MLDTLVFRDDLNKIKVFLISKNALSLLRQAGHSVLSTHVHQKARSSPRGTQVCIQAEGFGESFLREMISDRIWNDCLGFEG